MAGIEDLLSMFADQNRKTSEDPHAPSAPQMAPTQPDLPGPLGKLRDLLNTPVNQVPGKLEQMQLPDGGVRDAANTPLRDVPGNVARQVGPAPQSLPADSTTTGSDVPGMVAPPKPAGTPPGAPDTLEAIRQVLVDSTDSAPRADTDVPGMIAPQKPGVAPPNFGGAPDISAMIKALANHVPNVEATPMPPASGMPGAPVAPASGFEAFLKSLGNPGDEQPPAAGPEAKQNWAANTVTEANPNAESPGTTPAVPTKVSAGGDSAPATETGQSKSLGGTLSQGSKGNGSRAGSAVGGVFSSDRKDEENQALHAGLLQFALSALLKPSWGGGSGLWNAINDASDTYNNYGAQRKAERDETDTRAKNAADLDKTKAETVHAYASADNQRASAGKAKKETDTLVADKGKEDPIGQMITQKAYTPKAAAVLRAAYDRIKKDDPKLMGGSDSQALDAAETEADAADAKEKAKGVSELSKSAKTKAQASADKGMLDMDTLNKVYPGLVAKARTNKATADGLRAHMKNNATELAKLEKVLK